jgi:hypothetical protein
MKLTDIEYNRLQDLLALKKLDGLTVEQEAEKESLLDKYYDNGRPKVTMTGEQAGQLGLI